MKVKHALTLGGVSLITLLSVGYMVYDGLTMTDKEVEQHLEGLHNTDLSIKRSTDTKDGVLYTMKVEDHPSFEFDALVGKSDSNKAYVKSSSYDSEKARTEVASKVKEFLPFLSDLGFELYKGGTVIPTEGKDGKAKTDGTVKAEQYEPEIEPYAVGISSEGVVSTRVSLIYKEPLTLFTLDASYDTIYNAVKAIKGMELENPYLDIRGKDGESTSGRVLLADLDTLNSAEDVYKMVTNALSSSEDVPSMTLTDEEIKDMGIDSKK